MENSFTPSPNAEAWQMSTAPMLLLASHKASLDIFKQAGFKNLLSKSKLLSDYLFFVLNEINQPEKRFTILTPRNSNERGCQVSLSVFKNAKAVFDELLPNGIFADWREPNVIRVAPVPLYNSFEEIFTFAATLKQILKKY